MYANVRTPKESDPDVQRLLKYIDSEIELAILSIEPESFARESDCIGAVREKVKRAGGRIVYGWQIWKCDHLVEAEFHAVWETPDGELKDITPKNYPGITHILFLEDEKTIYEDKAIDNKRINISGNELVDHLFAVNKADFRLKNRGAKALLHDEEFLKSLTPEELRQLEELAAFKNNLSYMLDHGATVNSPCHCGSQKKYKNCHGKNFLKRMSQL
jgi:hypothetical protein